DQRPRQAHGTEDLAKRCGSPRANAHDPGQGNRWKHGDPLLVNRPCESADTASAPVSHAQRRQKTPARALRTNRPAPAENLERASAILVDSPWREDPMNRKDTD